MGGQASLAGMWWSRRWGGALGGEGKFDAAGGVALITGHALEAAVVIQVAGAGCAHTVQLSMGELRAFHVHLNLLCRMEKWWKGRRTDQFNIFPLLLRIIKKTILCWYFISGYFKKLPTFYIVCYVVFSFG